MFFFLEVHVKEMIYSLNKLQLGIHPRVLTALQMLLGSLYIALLAQIEVPLKPVPMTLHTFAVMTLGLFAGKRVAAGSALLYLGEATLGLPVFPGFWSNPLWMMQPTAGYCLGFPVAAYAIGRILESFPKKNLFAILVSLCAGNGLIFALGIAWLACFVGFEQAIVLGLLPFVWIDCLKMAAAASIRMTARQWAVREK